MTRSPRFFASLASAAFVIGACVSWRLYVPVARPEIDTPSPGSPQTSAASVQPDAATETAADPDEVPTADSAQIGAGGRLAFPVLDADMLARTSWPNPCQPGLWQLNGWSMNENAMTAGMPSAVATFLRPYRGLMVEFDLSTAEDALGRRSNSRRSVDVFATTSTSDVRPVDASLVTGTSPAVGLGDRSESVAASDASARNAGDDTESESDSDVNKGRSDGLSMLSIRLTTRAGEVVTSLEVFPDRVVLFAHRGDQHREVRRSAGGDDLAHARCWLSVTANRLMLRANDRLLINAPQGTHGSDLHIQVVATDAGLTLTNLRFEGE